MSFALILFDYDGCTSVVPSSRFGPNVRVSEKHTFKYNGKDHLVEVLDLSGKFISGFSRYMSFIICTVYQHSFSSPYIWKY